MLILILVVIACVVLSGCTFFYFFPVVRICGNSMYPTLMDGEFYLGRKVFKKDKCQIGEIYVYRAPYEDGEVKYVIKRLKHINYRPNGEVLYYFLGDNKDDSYDSRYYGYVDCRNVVAHIILRKEV